MAVVVAAGAGGGWAVTHSGSSAADSPSFRLVAAATTTMRQTASSTGTIEPTTTSTLSFTASGQVTSVNVKAGDKVTEGQALATIDSASLQAQVAQAKASLAAAQSRLSQDQTNSASSAQIAADQASVTADQSQVNSANDSLSGATLTSPVTGTVASVGLTVGQQVSGGSGGSGGSGNGSSGSSSSPSDSITVISSTYVVNASVDATVVGDIKTGDQAVITTGGASSPVYGTVGSVGLIATSSSGVVSFPVVIDVTGTPSGLYAGASATVSIIYRQFANVLAVPAAAVHTSNGKSAVYIMANGRQVERTVTTGLISGGQIQITSGLTAGEQVVVDVPRITNTSTGSAGNGRSRPGGGFFPGGGGFFPGGNRVNSGGAGG